MPYIPPQVVQEVKQMDLLTYLKNYEPYELVHFSGNTYTTRTHDSLKISNGKWMWWSRGIGGRSALDYLIKVKDYSFLEAVELLAGRANIQPPLSVSEHEQIEKSKVPAALARFLKEHPDVKEIVLHLDNDRIGRLATKAIQTVIPEKYHVQDQPPVKGKDCNDMLCLRLNLGLTRREKSKNQKSNRPWER